MRAVVQRVSQASVRVDGKTIGTISQGLLVLLGITHNDTNETAEKLAQKIIGLRIFQDPDNRMNLALEDVDGAMLVVSQFTLYGDCRKGRRPGFVDAARPEIAIPIYDEFINTFRRHGIEVQTGKFGASMEVELVNSGPVTLMLDTNEL